MNVVKSEAMKFVRSLLKEVIYNIRDVFNSTNICMFCYTNSSWAHMVSVKVTNRDQRIFYIVGSSSCASSVVSFCFSHEQF